MSQFSDAQNIVVNGFLPWNPLDPNKAFGTVQYVAWEVIVTKIFRRLLNFPQKSFADLIQVHAVSMAFLGGAGAPFGDVGGLDQTVIENLKDGAKGIPAVLLAQYTVDTFKRGFHVPGRGWTMSDVFASAAAKTISRPLFGLIYGFIAPRGLAAPMDAINRMQVRQSQASLLPRIAS